MTGIFIKRQNGSIKIKKKLIQRENVVSRSRQEAHSSQRMPEATRN
jgi:hypothetical protein